MNNSSKDTLGKIGGYFPISPDFSQSRQNFSISPDFCQSQNSLWQQSIRISLIILPTFCIGNHIFYNTMVNIPRIWTMNWFCLTKSGDIGKMYGLWRGVYQKIGSDVLRHWGSISPDGRRPEGDIGLLMSKHEDPIFRYTRARVRTFSLYYRKMWFSEISIVLLGYCFSYW